MEGYRITLLLLCCYGFFKELRPSEPYLTEYLIGNQWKNLTEDAVYNKVYPIWPYSYFGLLVPVFLLTDLLRYKPVIIFEGISYIVTWSLLLWANGTVSMQIMEFFYGIATSTEVAYYTYIFAKVPKESYKRVASITRSAILFGKFISGLTSQLLTSFDLLDYGQLNYISLTSVCIAFAISLALPKVTTSIYFHRSTEDEVPATNESKVNPEPNAQTSGGFSVRNAIAKLSRDTFDAYKQGYVAKWSLWVALSTCCNFQVGNYIQTLWEDIKPFEDSGSSGEEDTEIYNGAVEAATTLLGAIVVFAVGFLNINWKKLWGDVAIVTVAAVSSILLYVMSITDEIWVAYIGYLVYRTAYQALMTVATFEIVKHLPDDAYGLIYGINVFFGLGFQTVLTYVVNNKLEMEPRPQFVVYSVYFIATSAIFLPFLIYNFWTRRQNRLAKFTQIHRIAEQATFET